MPCLKMQPRLLHFAAWLLVLASSLPGCAGNTDLLAETLRAAARPSATDPTGKLDLDPSYRYLRATLDGRTFLLYLGVTDTDTQTNELIQVWYSGQGEVIRIKNGRIISATGVTADMVVKNYAVIPSWADALKNSTNGRTTEYKRRVDAKESYRFGVLERVKLQVAVTPILLKPAGIARQNTVWMQESYTSQRALPPSFFALVSTDVRGDIRVYYSKQCLSNQMCLELQEWTPEDHAAQRAKEHR